MVYRIYVEKKPGFDGEAQGLLHELVERAGQLGIFRDLCRQLVLQRLQLLLLGRDGDLVPDQPYKHSGAYDDQHRKYDPLHQKLGAGQPAAFSHLGCPLPRHAHYYVWLII